jgi:ATP-dependent DNA helicase RecG
VPGATVANLSAAALTLFGKRVARSGRVDGDALQKSEAALLDNLHLIDSTYLKRAALLLFHLMPEKFVTGAYLEIGCFATDEELRYQDEVHGPVLEQIERGLDVLLTKCLTADIHYKGAERAETLPFPRPAWPE